MATSTFYPAVDGGLRRYTGAETWQQAHDATSASNVYDTLANTSCVASYTSLGLITRSFFSFDTSSLPDDAVIDSATLTITGSGAVTGSNGSVQLVASSQASGTALVANDYDNLGTTAFATGINLGSWATGGANVFTLNSSGLAAISATGYTTLALRHSSDLNNSSPGSDNAVPAYFSEQTGTASDPVLSVTYHLGRSTADAWAWSDVGDISGFSGGTIRTYSRATVGDTWAWADSMPASTPAARTAGTQRSVIASGTVGTTAAHVGMPTIVRTGTPTTPGKLIVLVRRGTTHTSRDGSLVCTVSTDDGASWGTPTVVRDYATTGYDARDVQAEVLPSGRIAVVHSEYKAIGGHDAQRTIFFYSDDEGVSWSTPVVVSTGMYDGSGTNGGNDVGSDIVRLANDDLLIVGYATETDAATKQFGLYVTKSTDDGVTWANLSKPITFSSYSNHAVEPQIERFENGKLVMTFHIENGPPQYCYRTTSTDGGATWASPTLHDNDVLNRQGLALADHKRRALIAYQPNATRSFRYTESTAYGASYPTDVSIAAADFGGASETYPLWCMGVGLAGEGASQNVGFVYSSEGSGQDRASVWFKQFSGLDGSFINPRTTSDTWAWSDAAAVTNRTYGKTTTDSWAWSDAAVGTTAFARTAADAWAWSDTAANTHAAPSYYSRTTSDTWAWSERTTAPGTAFYWLRAARRRSMSAPTKTYVAVVPNGTTKTATYTSPTYEAKTEAGILVVLDVTAASGTGGLTVRINAHDQASSQAVALNAAPTAVTATGTTSYALYPFGAVAGNVTQATSFYLPRMFSISVTAGDSSSYTYSLGYCLLP